MSLIRKGTRLSSRATREYDGEAGIAWATSGRASRVSARMVEVTFRSPQALNESGGRTLTLTERVNVAWKFAAMAIFICYDALDAIAARLILRGAKDRLLSTCRGPQSEGLR